MTSEHERTILRDLATKYRELCDSERNRQGIERWRRLNNLDSERPMIHCNTGLLGEEIAPLLPECRIEDRFLRGIEGGFHSQLWHADLGDDRIFFPWIDVRAVMAHHSEGIWGVERDRVEDHSSHGYRCMPVLETMEDLDKLKATEHRVLDPDPWWAANLRDMIGDILPIRIKRSTIYPQWGGTDLSEAAGALLGVEELLYLLMDEPEMVHRFMAFTRDAVLANLKQGEAAGDWCTADSWYYLTPTYCDDLPDPGSNGHGAKLKEVAHFSHQQEFEGVGPAQFEEFCLDYQRPIMDLFGRITYGCCDTLDRKLDLLATIPNLTKIASGPRSDPACFPELFGSRAVISWRPVPSIVASEHFDEDNQRRQIREGLEKLQGCHVEVHMHEPMTVYGDLDRVRRWAAIAREEAERFVA